MNSARAVRIVLALALALVAGGGCSVGLPEGVVYPSIEPQEAAPRTVTHEFTFEGELVTITVPVDGGLYAGAAAADKAVIRFGNARATDWIEDYYPAFVEEPHQDRFYTDVLAALRTIRDTRGLDADRYAELLCAFVQQLDYHTDPVDLSPKFPVETFVEGSGDCDDKALLLAGLLEREGYDVAILLFEPEQHVALGIRSAEADYKDTGYAFIETTAGGFVGMEPEEVGDGGTLTSEPRVFPIGSGSIPYTAGDEVNTILATREEAVAEATRLAPLIEDAARALSALKEEADAAREGLEALRTAGDFAAYNAAIPAYNELVERYNQAVEERNALVAQHNAYAELERTIVAGLHDRTGVFEAVSSARE